jgi:hypothetical protein
VQMTALKRVTHRPDDPEERLELNDPVATRPFPAGQSRCYIADWGSPKSHMRQWGTQQRIYGSFVIHCSAARRGTSATVVRNMCPGSRSNATSIVPSGLVYRPLFQYVDVPLFEWASGRCVIRENAH